MLAELQKSDSVKKRGSKVVGSDNDAVKLENKKSKVFANMYIGKKDSSKSNKQSP